MFGAWWWMWMAVMFICLVPPIGYGWGYRGWGPPYPSYVQRRRSEAATPTASTPAFNHYAWGWGGDVVWMVVLIGVFASLSTYLWR